MSQWTHIAGLIRLDSMGAVLVRLPVREMNDRLKVAVAKALGNTCDFESSIEASEVCNVPCGSEGSLQYKVLSNSDSDKDAHALSWGYVVIWGDLRNFGTEDYPEVLEWFQKSLEQLQHPEGFGSPDDMSQNDKALYAIASFGIRDAVLSVHAEYSPCKILIWDSEVNKVIEVAR